MPPLRRFANILLRFMLRCSRAEDEEWGRAMLHEMDFIESDWAAFWWALGCTTAIWRHSLSSFIKSFQRQAATKEAAMTENGRRAVGFASGLGVAAGVAAVALGILWVLFTSFPAMMETSGQWIHLLIGVFIPETIFIITTILLWKKRRPMAVGILLFAAVAGTHVLVHFAHHWRG